MVDIDGIEAKINRRQEWIRRSRTSRPPYHPSTYIHTRHATEIEIKKKNLSDNIIYCQYFIPCTPTHEHSIPIHDLTIESDHLTIIIAPEQRVTTPSGSHDGNIHHPRCRAKRMQAAVVCSGTAAITGDSAFHPRRSVAGRAAGLSGVQDLAVDAAAVIGPAAEPCT